MSQERGSGFLTAVIMAALLAIGVAIAFPLFSQDLRQEFTEETGLELDRLRRAIEAFYEDNEAFPVALSDLQQEPAWAQQWLGPYASAAFVDEDANNLSVLKDSWRRDYVYLHPDPFSTTVRSKGPNGVDNGGGGDDIELTFAIHYILWKITIRELRVVRASISAYNANVAPPWLPNPWVAVVNRLQAKDCLASGPYWKFDYRYDGWNQMYVPVGNPCVNATSDGPP